MEGSGQLSEEIFKITILEEEKRVIVELDELEEDQNEYVGEHVLEVVETDKYSGKSRTERYVVTISKPETNLEENLQ